MIEETLACSQGCSKNNQAPQDSWPMKCILPYDAAYYNA